MFSTVLITSCSLPNSTGSDQAALDSLREAGSDLTKFHPFDFFLYPPDETSAEKICAELRAAGFHVTVSEGATEGEWLCLASLSLIPSVGKLSEVQGLLDDLVDKYGGEYDGWETIVVP